MRRQPRWVGWVGVAASIGAILTVFISLAPPGARAQGNSGSKGTPKGKPTASAPSSTMGTTGDKIREVLPASQPIFSSREVTIITDWFHTNTSDLPPGLAKREKLPPGLERQLQKNGKLPPGLAKKVVSLPFELERRLSPIPTGYRRVVLGGNVITMEPVTGVIYDIIRGIVP